MPIMTASGITQPKSRSFQNVVSMRPANSTLCARSSWTSCWSSTSGIRVVTNTRVVVEKLGQLKLTGDLGDAAGEVGDRVEAAEDGEILPYREPVRHVDIGTLKIHPVQHLIALARHFRAEHARGPRRGHYQAQDHRDGGGLAGAVAAEKPGDGAALERERNAVDRAGGLVDLHQLVNGDGGLGGLGHVGYRWRASATCGPAGRTRQGLRRRGNAPLPARPAAAG